MPPDEFDDLVQSSLSEGMDEFDEFLRGRQPTAPEGPIATRQYAEPIGPEPPAPDPDVDQLQQEYDSGIKRISGMAEVEAEVAMQPPEVQTILQGSTEEELLGPQPWTRGVDPRSGARFTGPQGQMDALDAWRAELEPRLAEARAKREQRIEATREQDRQKVLEGLAKWKVYPEVFGPPPSVSAHEGLQQAVRKGVTPASETIQRAVNEDLLVALNAGQELPTEEVVKQLSVRWKPVLDNEQQKHLEKLFAGSYDALKQYAPAIAAAQKWVADGGRLMDKPDTSEFGPSELAAFTWAVRHSRKADGTLLFATGWLREGYEDYFFRPLGFVGESAVNWAIDAFRIPGSRTDPITEYGKTSRLLADARPGTGPIREALKQGLRIPMIINPVVGMTMMTAEATPWLLEKMSKTDLDPRIAAPLAVVGAAAIGLIEYAQNMAFAGRNPLGGKARDMVTDYIINTGVETLEEGAQGVIEHLIPQLARALAGQETPGFVETFMDALREGGAQAREALPTIMLLSAPGTIANQLGRPAEAQVAVTQPGLGGPEVKFAPGPVQAERLEARHEEILTQAEEQARREAPERVAAEEYMRRYERAKKVAEKGPEAAAILRAENDVRGARFELMAAKRDGTAEDVARAEARVDKAKAALDKAAKIEAAVPKAKKVIEAAEATPMPRREAMGELTSRIETEARMIKEPEGEGIFKLEPRRPVARAPKLEGPRVERQSAEAPAAASAEVAPELEEPGVARQPAEPSTPAEVPKAVSEPGVVPEPTPAAPQPELTAKEVARYFDENRNVRGIIDKDTGKIYVPDFPDLVKESEARNAFELVTNTKEGIAAHEVGHQAYDKLPPKLKEQWERLHSEVSERMGLKTDPEEEFNHAYSLGRVGRGRFPGVPEYDVFMKRHAETINKVAPETTVKIWTPKKKPKMAAAKFAEKQPKLKRVPEGPRVGAPRAVEQRREATEIMPAVPPKPKIAAPKATPEPPTTGEMLEPKKPPAKKKPKIAEAKKIQPYMQVQLGYLLKAAADAQPAAASIIRKAVSAARQAARQGNEARALANIKIAQGQLKKPPMPKAKPKAEHERDLKALAADAPSHLKESLRANPPGPDQAARIKGEITTATTQMAKRLGRKHFLGKGETRKPTFREAVKRSWTYGVFGTRQLNPEVIMREVAGEKSVAYDMIVNRTADASHAAAGEYVKGNDLVLMSMKQSKADIEYMAEVNKKIVPFALPPGGDVKVWKATVDEAMGLVATARDPKNMPFVQRDGVTLRANAREVHLRAEDVKAVETYLAKRYRPGWQFLLLTRQEVINRWGSQGTAATYLADTGRQMPVHESYCPRFRDGRHVGEIKANLLLPDTPQQDAMADLDLPESEQEVFKTLEALKERPELMKGRRPTQQELRDWRRLKERTEIRAPLLIRPYSEMLAEYVHQASNYIGKATTARDAQLLLSDKRFRQALVDGIPNGAKVHQQLVEHVQAWKAVDPKYRPDVEKWMNAILRRAARAVLAQPQIYGYQAVSIENAAQEMPRRYLYDLVGKRGVLLNDQQIKRIAPEIYLRFRGDAHFLISPALTPGKGDAWNMFYGGKAKWIDRITMGPLHAVDTMVIRRIVSGCYQWAKDDGLTGPALMTEARRRAMRVINRTQPTMDPMTIANLQLWGRTHPGAKVFVMFSSQSTKNLNMAYAAALDFQASDKSTGAYAKLVRDTVRPTLMNAAAIYLMSHGYGSLLGLLTGAKPREKEWWDHISGMLDRVYGGWLGGRDILFELKRKATDVVRDAQAELRRQRGEEVRGRPPFLREEERRHLFMTVWVEMARMFGKVGDALAQNIIKGKGRRRATVDAMLQTIRSVSLLTGAPGLAVERPLRPLLRDAARRK